ncbi:MAG: hypothetical protein AAF579_22130, partial [Cyanobacteria bacterium P01_C01_bin.118]
MAEVNNSNDAVQPSADSANTDADGQEKYVAEASSFIENTSLDKMLEMAEEAVRKKMIARAT